MKPYISIVYEHNGKTRLIPVNARYRELLDVVRDLGLKDAADEDDLNVIGFVSRFEPAPSTSDDWALIDAIDKKLNGFTNEQAETLCRLCQLFNIRFSGIMDIIEKIEFLEGKNNEIR